MDSKREMILSRHQRALQSSKDASASSASLIEFPNGLPPAPPRNQKEKPSEMEQQLKTAEAAQKHRMQVEKAVRESEAEAIRKILGQDSSRKKREEKMKKHREELAQKAANAQMLASSPIRYVMSPTGTTVTFPEEMGLPSTLNSKPISYPPPHEKCAGTCCTNPYKYRDSKYLFAVSNATRLYMKRWRLKLPLPLPLPLDVAKDPLSLAYASGTLDGFLSWAFGRDLILEIVHLLYYTFSCLIILTF